MLGLGQPKGNDPVTLINRLNHVVQLSRLDAARTYKDDRAHVLTYYKRKYRVIHRMGTFMEVDAFLCDHAQAAEGKLFVNGAGINILWAQAAQEPYGINVSVASIAQVPWTATNQAHTFRVHVEDEDNRKVRPWAPDGHPELDEVALETAFTVGRPPNLQVGEAQTVPFAFAFNFPVAKLGLYSFVITVDGSEMKRLPIRLTLMPQQQVFG